MAVALCAWWTLVVFEGRAARADDLSAALGIAAVAVVDRVDTATALDGAVRVDLDAGIGREADTVLVGGDAWLESSGDGWLHGSQWLGWRHVMSDPGAAADDAKAWLALEHRFDYELRVPLSRRRDLLRGRLTGEQLRFDAVPLGGDGATEGGAFMPITWDIDVIDRPGAGVDVLNRLRMTAGRFWSSTTPGGERHERVVLEIDSYLHDRSVDRVVNTVIVYGERGHPAEHGAAFVDFRIGFASNGGRTALSGKEYVNTAHPEVTAGILDGAVHVPLGNARLDVRYDRSMYLTQESTLALEDRGTVSAAWTTARFELSAEAFVARTALWSERDPDAVQVFRSDGVSASMAFHVGGVTARAGLELGHSFYTDPDVDAAAPSVGARTLLSLSYRVGCAPPPLGAQAGE